MATKKNKMESALEKTLSIVKPEDNQVFNVANENILEGFIEASMPVMIKPKDFPIGQALIGEILEVQNIEIDEAKKKKNAALILLQLETGRKVCVPATSVLCRALKITGVEEGEPECGYVGKTVAIICDGQKESKRGLRDFWNFRVLIKG